MTKIYTSVGNLLLQKMTVLLFSAYFLSLNTFAQTTFDGSTDNDFNKSSNWTGGTVPNGVWTTDMTFAANCDNTNAQTNFTAWFSSTCTVNAGVTWDINGGAGTIGPSTNAVWINNGTVNQSQNLGFYDGTITNNGTMNFTGGTCFAREIIDNNSNITFICTLDNDALSAGGSNPGTFTNDGTWNMNGAIVSVNGTTFTNNAGKNWNINSGTFDLETAGVTFNNAGNLTIDGSFELPSTFTNTGDIYGTGTIINVGYSSTISGNMNPGNSVGTLNTTGNITFDGTIKIEVDNGSSFDVINSTNSSTLTISSATVQFIFSGTNYNNGQTFAIFTNHGSVSNPMTITNNNGYTIVHNGNGVFEITAGALPVELISFNAKASNQTTKLTWQTASETNNKGFEIEHLSTGQAGSLDNRTWETIGFVSGEGTTFEKQSYSFLHKNPAHGVNYYRLKQMDYDGVFEYSDVVSVELSVVGSQLSVSPNPTQTGEVTLYIPETDFEEATLEIFNLMGILVQTERVFSNQMTVRTADLSNGIYLFSLKVGGQRSVERVVVN